MQDDKVQNWEYETMESIGFWTNGAGVKNDINLMGSQGWELVSITSFLLIVSIYIFKRPITPQTH